MNLTYLLIYLGNCVDMLRVLNILLFSHRAKLPHIYFLIDQSKTIQISRLDEFWRMARILRKSVC